MKFFHNILNNKKLRSMLIALISFITTIILLDIIFPLPNLKPYSKVIRSSDGSLLAAYLTPDDKWRLLTKLDDVSHELIKAIIEKEDRWFYYHPGVNLISLFQALFKNISAGTIVSGASTITMQTVRLLEPEDRTYINKFLEMLRAVQLELHYSKDEILEIYLSLLPYGGNVEGVSSCSYIYLNTPPSKLSLAQSVLLTVIPNDPNGLRIDINPNAAIKKRNFWLDQYKMKNVFSSEEIEDAKEEPIVQQRQQIQKIAPHFTDFLFMNYQEEEINTFLDIKKQKTAEKLLLNHVGRVRSRNVSNGAVIIINNRTHGIEAYCGSADFYDAHSYGQVDGVRAIRSPGSTLKPGLYALSFDMGLMTPQMTLLDLPTDFIGYEPENYTNEFHGEVTVRYALQNSLNIPAVELLKAVGFQEYLELLIKSGFQQIKRDKRKLGLSLILGGCGVTLIELTEYFSAFANGGFLHPARFIRNDDKSDSIRIFSSASSFMISEILSGIERPDLPNALLQHTNLPKIAWKTGTSYGKRDGWAIGYNPNYTIGVWMGNFDGKGSPYLSGAEMAVPLLFDLFNAIDHSNQKSWFHIPNDCLIRDVCAETGLLPGKYCKSTVPDYYIKNVSHKNSCKLRREFYVNEDSTVSYCKECLPDSGYITAVYPVYPPKLTLWYETNGISYSKPPPHNKECQARFSGEGPVIISPSDNYEYYVERGAAQEILLQAATETGNEAIYWYINNKYFAKCLSSERVFFTAKEGKHIISCMDESGKEQSIEIIVKYY
jgi:penicillin-binding protein 1C